MKREVRSSERSRGGTLRGVTDLRSGFAGAPRNSTGDCGPPQATGAWRGCGGLDQRRWTRSGGQGPTPVHWSLGAAHHRAGACGWGQGQQSQWPPGTRNGPGVGGGAAAVRAAGRSAAHCYCWHSPKRCAAKDRRRRRRQCWWWCSGGWGCWQRRCRGRPAAVGQFPAAAIQQGSGGQAVAASYPRLPDRGGLRAAGLKGPEQLGYRESGASQDPPRVRANCVPCD